MVNIRSRSIFAARLVRTTGRDEAPDVLNDMRRAILSGDEPPGTAIPIDGVAQVFGVSQIPVREALKILLGEGLVEHIPHIGYSVAKLTVADSGPGMSEQHLAHVFERFYRADATRARPDGGAGLGLSIVAAVAEAHGGTVSVRSEPGTGTSFTVTLPLLPVPALMRASAAVES